MSRVSGELMVGKVETDVYVPSEANPRIEKRDEAGEKEVRVVE